jgi:hypothetical protein
MRQLRDGKDEDKIEKQLGVGDAAVLVRHDDAKHRAARIFLRHKALKLDDFELNRHRALAPCLGMISAQTLRVCREGKPFHVFPDHA